MFARWHDKRGNDRHRRAQISQETPVPQLFLRFAIAARGARSKSPRQGDGVRKPVSRTLSRDFWQ
jgi:hypothetical protein